MLFSPPLRRGTLLRRYQRFLSDVTLASGQVVVAHCANTGAMTGLAEPGMTVLLSESTNPKRKLAYTWEMSLAQGTWVGVNTGLTNRLVREALDNQAIPPLHAFETIRPEVVFEKGSRLDFLLSDSIGRRCWMEVKSVTLRWGEGLAFPDAVTQRGTRHLHTLMEAVKKGDRAVLFFLAQRGDGKYFTPASDIDPTYARTLQKAAQCGVEIMVWQCRLNETEITVSHPLPMESMNR